MVESVAKRTLETHELTLLVEPSLTQRLLAEGSSRRFGARPLRRTVQRLVEDVVAVAILEGFVTAGDTVTLGTTGSSAEGDDGSKGGYDVKTVTVARAVKGDRPEAVLEVPVSLSIGIEDCEDDEMEAPAPPPPPANNVAPDAFTPEALASVATAK
jgi:hypothetical protein